MENNSLSQTVVSYCTTESNYCYPSLAFVRHQKKLSNNASFYVLKSFEGPGSMKKRRSMEFSGLVRITHVLLAYTIFRNRIWGKIFRIAGTRTKFDVDTTFVTFSSSLKDSMSKSIVSYCFFLWHNRCDRIVNTRNEDFTT